MATDILCAAGRLRAAQLHRYADREIERRRQQLAVARCLVLLERAGALPLSPESVAELTTARAAA